MMARAFHYYGGILGLIERRSFSLMISLPSPRFVFPNRLSSPTPPPLPPPIAVKPFYSDIGCRYHCTDNVVTVSNDEPQLEYYQPMPRSNGLVDLEYADLNLIDKISEEIGHVRIRQHVNPLSTLLSTPAQAPDWNQVFSDPTLPLMVDIGCGSGRFLLWHAKKNPDSRNHLGLEIRQKLVKRANYWVKELSLNNIHFMYANATVSFHQIASTYPGPLTFTSILCPDPHFKKKHHKRRVVQKSLVDYVVKHLAPGGKIFIQSDVLDVALDMKDQFDAELGTLEDNPNMLSDNCGWLLNNPMGIRSEREIHAEFEGAKIYRRIYQKKLI